MEPDDRVRVEWEFDQIEAEVTGPESIGKIPIRLDSGDEVIVPAETVHPLDGDDTA
jgi:hypothetical protein